MALSLPTSSIHVNISTVDSICPSLSLSQCFFHIYSHYGGCWGVVRMWHYWQAARSSLLKQNGWLVGRSSVVRWMSIAKGEQFHFTSTYTQCLFLLCRGLPPERFQSFFDFLIPSLITSFALKTKTKTQEIPSFCSFIKTHREAIHLMNIAIHPHHDSEDRNGLDWN